MENDFAHLPVGNFVQRLWSVQAAYAWSPNLVLSSFVQFDTESQNVGTNTRLRWTIRPGNDLYGGLESRLAAHCDRPTGQPRPTKRFDRDQTALDVSPVVIQGRLPRKTKRFADFPSHGCPNEIQIPDLAQGRLSDHLPNH